MNNVILPVPPCVYDEPTGLNSPFGSAETARIALRGAATGRWFEAGADQARGWDTVSGEIAGFASLALVTESMEDAVEGADVVVLTLPTAALPAYANALADATNSEQIIWLAVIHPTRMVCDHRYLHEDVCWGLVPWMHLAAKAETSMPTVAAVTHLASLITGVDYVAARPD